MYMCVFVYLSQVSPYCGGIGVASAFVSFNVALYYNTIIAWCLYYLAGVSVAPKLACAPLLHADNFPFAPLTLHSS